MKLKNPEIRIETTTYCNSRCTICPRPYLNRSLTEMSNFDFYDLVDQAYDLGAKMIALFGFGEPLMDTGLESKIQYCTNSGLESFITTNGSLLTTERIHRLIICGLSKIRFSVHGFGLTYEKVHRNLNFDDTMRNINVFLQVNKKQYNNACTTCVTVIPMHGEPLEQIKEFWLPKVDELEVWKPHNFVYGKQFREVKPRKRTCGRPQTGPVQIQSDGKMVVCCFDYDGRMVVGDTKTDKLEDIIKGERFNRIREKHNTGDLSGLPCESCDQLNIEEENPLLYSSVDKDRAIGKTSSLKFKLEEKI
jgi:MoaA/NifB/PqqE/SkfB family radical SAM enzyme